MPQMRVQLFLDPKFPEYGQLNHDCEVWSLMQSNLTSPMAIVRVRWNMIASHISEKGRTMSEVQVGRYFLVLLQHGQPHLCCGSGRDNRAVAPSRLSWVLSDMTTSSHRPSSAGGNQAFRVGFPSVGRHRFCQSGVFSLQRSQALLHVQELTLQAIRLLLQQRCLQAKSEACHRSPPK